MNWLFSPPSLDDLIRLLKAWRFWTLGALLGALIGAAVFYIAPPPFRARATVLVDFNLEEAWPEETDRQQFYYLERETRKMEEIARSDEVIGQLSSQFGISVSDLRSGKLQLSQPAEGGWHFYAIDKNSQQAQELASLWAQSFAEQVSRNVANSEGLNSFIEVTIVQGDEIPVISSLPLSTYLLIGAIGFIAISAFLLLFFLTPRSSPIGRGDGSEG